MSFLGKLISSPIANPASALGLFNSASPTALAKSLLGSVPKPEQMLWGQLPSLPKLPGLPSFSGLPSLPGQSLIPSSLLPAAFKPSVSSAPAVSSVDNKTLAALASDVYGASAPGTVRAGNFREATPADLAKLGLTSADLISNNSAFRARVYVEGSGADARYVVAFRGSTSDKSDWISNAKQALGVESDHYQKALNIGKQLARSGVADVTLTGHSLGGGLASAASIASGKNGVTFNAAGLSDATISRANSIRTNAGVGNAGAVNAYYVRGEILSAIQDGGDRLIGGALGGLGGALVGDLPEAYGNRIGLDAVRPQGVKWYQDTPFARHGINWVQASLK
jgi:hypothetical protein